MIMSIIRIFSAQLQDSNLAVLSVVVYIGGKYSIDISRTVKENNLVCRIPFEVYSLFVKEVAASANNHGISE